MRVRVVRSPFRDIFLNLALEDALLRDEADHDPVLLLWRDDPAVVVGRFQNPWAECRPHALAAEGAVLARRQSGGGAVWHDPGNLCFSFIGDREGFDRRANTAVVVDALRALGAPAYADDRLDVRIDGAKVSGSAFRETARRAFHHGTVLVDADLGRLRRCLRPVPARLESSCVASVRSPVANIGPAFAASGADDPVEEAGRAIAEAFARARGADGIDYQETGSFAETDRVTDFRRAAASSAWILESTPAFAAEAEFPADGIERKARARVAGGKLAGMEIEGPEGKVTLEIGGVDFSPRDLAAALREDGRARGIPGIEDALPRALFGDWDFAEGARRESGYKRKASTM